MREAIREALKEAMKARDAARTSTLRLVSAAIQGIDIEARGKGREKASDEELAAALSRMIRQREESVRLYAEGGRPELAANEQAEMEVIRTFLPQQMGEEEVEEAARDAIAAAAATSPRDMGRVMGLLKERYAGKMDLGKASALVRSLLG